MGGHTPLGTTRRRFAPSTTGGFVALAERGSRHYAGNPCQVDHDACWSRPFRSRVNRAARWVWSCSAAWSCWACRVGRNAMLVWKKVQVSQMASKARQRSDRGHQRRWAGWRRANHRNRHACR
jgi:hypothetical protein